MKVPIILTAVLALSTAVAVKRPHDPCRTCHHIIEKAEHHFQNGNITQGQLQRELEHECIRLAQSEGDDAAISCLNIVQKNIAQIYTDVSNHKTADQVCQDIGECPKTTGGTPGWNYTTPWSWNVTSYWNGTDSPTWNATYSYNVTSGWNTTDVPSWNVTTSWNVTSSWNGTDSPSFNVTQAPWFNVTYGSSNFTLDPTQFFNVTTFSNFTAMPGSPTNGPISPNSTAISIIEKIYRILHH